MSWHNSVLRWTSCGCSTNGSTARLTNNSASGPRRDNRSNTRSSANGPCWKPRNAHWNRRRRSCTPRSTASSNNGNCTSGPSSRPLNSSRRTTRPRHTAQRVAGAEERIGGRSQGTRHTPPVPHDRPATERDGNATATRNAARNKETDRRTPVLARARTRCDRTGPRRSGTATVTSG